MLFIFLFIYWVVAIYSKDKLEYNLTHSYTAIIPLTIYIFFRNISPFVRSGVSMSLHDLGKTTLETYLLQHHIWLTSNAKTLLTIVPGNPFINFALATVLFFTVSKELYRLTMSLRFDHSCTCICTYTYICTSTYIYMHKHMYMYICLVDVCLYAHTPPRSFITLFV
jgi:hypothetical protein